MKAIYKLLILSCVCCCITATALLTACSSDNVSDLRLSGDCRVEALALDNYTGTIDLPSRTITYSQNATITPASGQAQDFSQPVTYKVTNNSAVRVLHDEARISSFVINDIYQGTIDQNAKTIVVYVPGSENIKALVPTITYSQNATITPASGQAQDFSQPVTYKVTNNSASTYTVTVIAIDKPKALFVGAASSMNDLDAEARTACEWMLANVPGSLYASFADIEADAVELDECKVIWWHFHVDGGVDGHDVFMAKAPEALAAKNQLRQFYENGGALFLTRYATNLPSFIGVTGDDEWTTPNNCWGQDEANAELCGGPWTFRIFDNQNDHPLFQGLVAGDNPQEVYCTDAGYHITNSTAQYHIGTDWGGYDNHAAWEARTGGKILGVGGDGAVVAWEYPAHDGKGGIICIGSGCYDWYSYTFEAGYAENYHRNIAIMTKNAINHLTK